MPEAKPAPRPPPTNRASLTPHTVSSRFTRTPDQRPLQHACTCQPAPETHSGNVTHAVRQHRRNNLRQCRLLQTAHSYTCHQNTTRPGPPLPLPSEAARAPQHALNGRAPRLCTRASPPCPRGLAMMPAKGARRQRWARRGCHPRDAGAAALAAADPCSAPSMCHVLSHAAVLISCSSSSRTCNRSQGITQR